MKRQNTVKQGWHSIPLISVRSNLDNLKALPDTEIITSTLSIVSSLTMCDPITRSCNVLSIDMGSHFNQAVPLPRSNRKTKSLLLMQRREIIAPSTNTRNIKIRSNSPVKVRIME